MRLGYLQMGAATLLATSLFSSEAHAHFKLLKPASWVKEDNSGNPQKISPCGVAKGDTSAPVTNAVTTYKAGETISVEWVDTIAHPGYFRIALAANRDDLKDPTIKQGADCSYDEKLTPKEPTGNVLADGLDFRPRSGFNDKAGKMFSHEVTLPDEPCDDCTLQVMQVMENDIQAISNCYYLHCADIKIVAADAETGDAGSTSNPKDASTPSTPASVSDAGEAVKDSGAKPAVRDAGGQSMSGGGESSGDDDTDEEPTSTGSTKDAGKSTKKDAASASSEDDDADPKPAKSDDGCSVSPSQASASGGLWFLLALGALLARRRRLSRAEGDALEDGV